MLRLPARVLAAAVAGALSGAGALALAFPAASRVAIPLDRQASPLLAGFWGPERSGERSFAWTAASAAVTLPGLDRRVPWRCAVSLRGARAAGVDQPVVTLSVDGRAGRPVTATNEFAEIVAHVPARPDRDGVVVTIASHPTFVPGPHDPRTLGVQVDGIACEPAGGAARPPRAALQAAAAAGSAFAAAFVALGAPWKVALPAMLAIAAIQALALVTGPALYTRYVDRLPWLAAWPAALAVAAAALRAATRGRLSPAARVLLALAAAVLFVVLLGLLHPLKSVVDAQFHAHRLAWVHQGRYLFTQPMPDGVAFPYAIALYVVSLPWMAVTGDHIALLRVVVASTQVLAGLLLAAAIVGRWRDPLAGVAALLMLALVPHWYVVVGNANLTAAFGQSMATIALVCAAVAVGPGRPGGGAALFAAAALAFLSHVSTFPTLAAALMVLAALCRWPGDGADRRAAVTIAVATVLAAIFAVVVYYGRFGEVYQSLDRVLGRAPAAATGPAPPGPAEVSPMPGLFPRGGPTPSTFRRAATAADVGRQAVGWPIAILAAIGAGYLIARRSRDRLTLAVLASVVAGLAGVVFSVLLPVEDAFYRYNVELVGRMIFATWPAVVALAGLGAAVAWRAGPAPRAAATLLVGAAVWLGASAWWSWLR